MPRASADLRHWMSGRSTERTSGSGIIATEGAVLESYKLLLFLHITAAVMAMGVTFCFPFLQAMAERQGVVTTRFFLQFGQRLARMVIWPGSGLILLFGIGLIFNEQTGYKDDFPHWLEAAIPLFVILVLSDVLIMRRVVSSALRELEGVPDTAELPATYAPLGKRIQMIGGLQGLGLIVIIFLMVWKPGA
jgi:uncharacterized membrane protein